jgi:hypothetical protein
VRDLTVGEAAARLSAEFPGLTASWLRRMEAAGRVSPRRNPAGFRRYTAADLDRIRAVLSAAAEQNAEAAAEPAAPAPAPPQPRVSAPQPTAESGPAAQSQRPLIHASGLKRDGGNPSGARRGGPGSVAVLTVVPDTSPAEQQGPAADPPEPAGRRGERRWPDAGFFAPDLGEVAMDRDRLAAAARIERGWVDELVGYGLLSDRAVFSGADLLVARACAELAELGFEPRHLRPVLTSAAKVAELAGSAPAGRSAQAAAAAVRLHSTLVRAELLRG